MYDLKQVIGWVEEAGQMALGYSASPARSVKKDGTIVTDADGAIEKFLRRKIQECCPDHQVLGEEMGSGRKRGASEYRWAIDPIDGTVNFALGLPFWGISVGLLKNDIPILGVVYLPRLQEMFWAEERKGAYLNGKRCRVCNGRSCHDEELFIVPSSCQRFEYRFRFKIRSLGSAAANLCYVARGMCIGALLEGWNLWDVAAGLCILQEAGAQVTDLNGIPLISLGGQAGVPLLATSPAYHSDLLAGVHYNADLKK